MSFGCWSKEFEKMLNVKKCQNRMLNTQRVRSNKFKNWPAIVTQKVIYKRYSKSNPQLLLKKWPTNVTKNRLANVTQKSVHNCYSKIGQHLLLKNWTTNVTQKLVHNFHSKIYPQTLLKKWYTNVTQKVYSKNVKPLFVHDFFIKN